MTENRKPPAFDVIVLERELKVVIGQDEDGMFIASVPELKGCHTQARTLSEARRRVAEATLLYLRYMQDRLKLLMEYREGE